MVHKSGLAFVVLADEEYPERIARMILMKMSNEFQAEYEAEKFTKIESTI